ncbi:hypothetical protein N0V85_004871 [Neurospora sp. IMI 360204]|nr:hypothetical protein N0V85_004871 [Neurospora sp. IMI 360204]
MTSDGVIPHVLCDRCSRIIHSDWVQERLARVKPWTGKSSWALDGDSGQEEKLRFFHNESLETGAWIMDDFVTVQLRKNCVENHPECNRYSSTQKDPSATWLPTRLIDVGEVPGKLAPRLVISAAEGLAQEKVQYFTLSHSWSISTKAHNLKLETENMAQLQDSIPLDDSLSKAFRDAMKTTQQLGSSKVVQGPMRTGKTMSDVYGPSRCNITALGTGGNDGCFTPRNPLQISPCRIKVCDDKSTIYAVNSLLESTFTENVEQSPLFKRLSVPGKPPVLASAFAESWPFKTDTPRVQQRLTEPTLRATGDTPFSSKTVFEALRNAEEQQV